MIFLIIRNLIILAIVYCKTLLLKFANVTIFFFLGFFMWNIHMLPSVVWFVENIQWHYDECGMCMYWGNVKEIPCLYVLNVHHNMIKQQKGLKICCIKVLYSYLSQCFNRSFKGYLYLNFCSSFLSQIIGGSKQTYTNVSLK